MAAVVQHEHVAGVRLVFVVAEEGGGGLMPLLRLLRRLPMTLTVHVVELSVDVMCTDEKSLMHHRLC